MRAGSSRAESHGERNSKKEAESRAQESGCDLGAARPLGARIAQCDGGCLDSRGRSLAAPRRTAFLLKAWDWQAGTAAENRDDVRKPESPNRDLPDARFGTPLPPRRAC